jgi:bifunctional non-homologous end joining protein LigD
MLSRFLVGLIEKQKGPFDETQPVSRRHNSLSERFPQLKQVGKAIKATTAVLDGEIVALDENGLPRFNALRSRHARTSIVFMRSPYCISMVLI